MILQNFMQGEWVSGEGEGSPIYDAVTGQLIHHATTRGLDFSRMLDYGRRVGNPALRKMTFQQRGLMLKKLALYLTKRKDNYYTCLLYTSPSPRDATLSRMPSSA